MALKYPNKLKRTGYWVRYENSEDKDFIKVWNLILKIVHILGLPFELSQAGISQLKFNPDVYAAIPIFMTYYDYREREMQYELKTLVGDTLNHSNINHWFQRSNNEYIQDAIYLLDLMICKIYGEEDHYICDSTGIATTIYEKIIYAGEEVLNIICNKLHIVVSYFEKFGVLVIKKAVITQGDANDSPVFRNKLVTNVKFVKGKRMHMDKGYDAEENMKKCFELGLIPNIVERKKNSGGLVRAKARKLYDDELRKMVRGLIEGIFGGLETAFGNKTRRRKPKCIEIFDTILALTHNIKTYFRALADPFV